MTDLLTRDRRPTGVAPAPGDVVAGRYLIREQIAEGGRGTVWSAEDGLLRRPVALKHLPPRRRSGCRDALVEARAAAVIRHPNVVSVHDLLTDASGAASIVMELLDGASLALTIARAGRCAPDVVPGIARALVEGLTAVHAAGVVHRDVKPGNVQLCRDGRVVLLDLGVAVRHDEPPGSHAEAAIAGTLPYLAPEVLVTGRSSPASDAYALGVTLFCALEGAPPFEVRCVQDLVDRSASEQPAPPTPRSGGPLRPLVRGLLHPSEGDRWSLDRARRWLDGLPSAAPRPAADARGLEARRCAELR